MFTKGNQAGAIRRKESIAKIIAQRIEKDGDSLSGSQLATLVSGFKTLTAKRRRRRPKEPEAKKVNASYQWLTPEQNEIHRAVMQIEAEEHAKGIVHRRYSDGSTE
jgi:hypothetical protein